MRVAVGRTITAGFGVALLILGVVGFFSYRSLVGLIEAADSVTHTHQVIAHFYEVLVLGVESKIREALTNLVFNAADALPQGGTITLRTRVLPRYVALEVADTGVGMDEETRQRCLEPFYTTKGERGSGLGLAMVYGIMQRHAGDLEVESTVGKGTTIRLVFPITQTAPAQTRPVEMPLQEQFLRILIVDDDPLVRKSLQDVLRAEGHAVTIADGGQAGITAFRTAHEQGEPFAAVITDLGMPYVDGREVARAVKQLTPTTPVILLTGWGRRMRAEGDLPLHVDRLLSKPPRMLELREALRALCMGEGAAHDII